MTWNRATSLKTEGSSPEHGTQSKDHLEVLSKQSIELVVEKGLVGAGIHARNHLARVDQDSRGADEEVEGFAMEGLRTTEPPEANSAEGEKRQGWKLP